MLRAVLLLFVWVVVTGGLHIDGLADMADAWIGGQGDADRTLEIMKDPQCGPSAVVAVVLLLLAKLAALNVLLLHSRWDVVLLIPLIGRLSLVATFLYLPTSDLRGWVPPLPRIFPGLRLEGYCWLLHCSVCLSWMAWGRDFAVLCRVICCIPKHDVVTYRRIYRR